MAEITALVNQSQPERGGLTCNVAPPLPTTTAGILSTVPKSSTVYEIVYVPTCVGVKDNEVG